MRVVVNTFLCEVNEVCMRSCSEVVRLGEDDQVTVPLDPVLGDLRPAVKKEVRSCPRRALSLGDRDFEEQA